MHAAIDLLIPPRNSSRKVDKSPRMIIWIILPNLCENVLKFNPFKLSQFHPKPLVPLHSKVRWFTDDKYKMVFRVSLRQVFHHSVWHFQSKFTVTPRTINSFPDFSSSLHVIRPSKWWPRKPMSIMPQVFTAFQSAWLFCQIKALPPCFLDCSSGWFVSLKIIYGVLIQDSRDSIYCQRAALKAGFGDNKIASVPNQFHIFSGQIRQSSVH